jgi:hypothetical protein
VSFLVWCCAQEVQASELQQAELEESSAAQQQLLQQHQQAVGEAARKRQELEADVAAAQQQLAQVQQQAQVSLLLASMVVQQILQSYQHGSTRHAVPDNSCMCCFKKRFTHMHNTIYFLPPGVWLHTCG